MGTERFREIVDEKDENRKQTVNTLFKSAIFKGSINYDIDRSIRRNVCNRERKRLDRLDLIPAEYDMISLENYLTNAYYRELILGKALKSILHEYDYIIIDCPPNLYTVTQNALLTSDYYIIPVVPDFLSHVGLEVLTRKIKELILGAPEQKLKLLGIIFTLGKEGVNVYEQGTERIRQTLSDLKLNKIVDSTATIIDPWVPYYAGVSEAALDCFPLCIHGGSNISKPKERYCKLTSNILDYLEGS
jgi:chromosome partitioning protein